MRLRVNLRHGARVTDRVAVRNRKRLSSVAIILLMEFVRRFCLLLPLVKTFTPLLLFLRLILFGFRFLHCLFLPRNYFRELWHAAFLDCLYKTLESDRAEFACPSFVVDRGVQTFFGGGQGVFLFAGSPVKDR